MTDQSRAFWNSQLDNANTIPHFASYPPRYEALSEKARARWGEGERIAVGEDPMQQVTRVATGRTDRAVVFIHGGYWRRYAAADFHFAAVAAHAADATLLNVDYRLLPGVRLADAVADAVAATRLAVEAVERAVVVGHSAGAHLAVEAALRIDRPIDAVVAVSGLYDLAPLRHAAIQDEIALTPDEVASFSPLTRAAHVRVPLTLAAGADETVEFRRQSATMHDAVREAGGTCALWFVPERNHSSVILDLADPQSALVRRIARLLQ